MDILVGAAGIQLVDKRVDGAHDQSRRTCGGREITSSQ
jgi:hypothetical protein